MFRTLFVCTVLLGSPWAVFAQCTAPPASPGNVTVTRVGGDLQVQWTDSTTDVPCKAERFYVEYSRLGGDVREFTVTPPVSSDPELTIPGVPFGGAHRVAVRSFNTKGISSASNRYLVENVCNWPAEPVSSVQAAASGRIVSIGWQHPGHCFITGWRIGVALSPDGPEVYEVLIAGNPSARSYAAQAPPGTYWIRVYAESYGRLTAPSPAAMVTVQ